MLRRGPLLLLLLAAAIRASAQQGDSSLYVEKAGPGAGGRSLEAAFSRAHVVLYAKWNTPLYPGRSYPTSVIVLNSDVTVEGTVHGDVVVINGSLHLTATANVDGSLLAYGGNIYDAAGAVVTGRRDAFPTARYDTLRTTRGLGLVYRGPKGISRDLFVLPGLYGFPMPLYDRVDGLTVGWGPELQLGDSALIVAPSVMYRSNLGAWDGAVVVSGRLGGAFVKLTAEQATSSNDRWIQRDFANSFMVLCCGKDFRNYWRTDAYEGRVGYAWSDTAHVIALWAGGRTERDWSVAAGGPWGITGTSSVNSMYRPNPAIAPGQIESWLVGIQGKLDGTMQLNATVQVEVPFTAPGDVRFTQITADVEGSVPITPTQHLLVRFHSITTSGDTAPPQRYGYLGGAGSVLTLPLLGVGGDQLLFVEGDYRFTFEGIHIPYSTPPSFSLAYTAGAAGVGKLPTLTQNIGARLEVKPFRLDFFVDPSTGETRTMLLLWFVR